MLIALLLAAAAPSPVCEKLTKEFDDNERFFTYMHDVTADMLKIKEDFYTMMAPYERDVAIAGARARAVGAYVSPRNTRSRDLEEVEKARQELKDIDEKYKAEGDRITTLLIANKCTPPDHVTSWYTYSKTNPNAPK